MTPQALVEDLLALGDTRAQQAWLDEHANELDLDLIAELKASTDQNLLRDPRAAQHSATVALAVAARLPDPLAMALAQWTAGNAAIYQGDYATCLDLYRAAASVYLAHDRTLEAARLQTNSVFALTNLGRYAEALAEAEGARRVLEPQGSTRFLGLLEQNVGVAYHHLGRYPEAIAAYGHARAIFATLDEPVKAAEMDVNLARTAMYLDDFAQATTLLEEARAVFVAHEQWLTVARTDLNLGTLLARQGRYQSSLLAYQQARAGFLTLDNEMEAAIVDLYRSGVYRALNLCPEALELADAAAQVVSKRGMVRQVALAKANQAAARRGLGDLAAADARFAEAHTLWTELGVELEATLLDLERAGLWRAMGQPERALNLLAGVLPVLERFGMQVRSSVALLLMAECQLDLKHTGEAAQLFQSALDRLAGQELAVFTYRGRYGLGRSAEEEQRLGDARQHYAAAVAALDDLQHTLLADELRAGFLDDKLEVYQAYVHVLLALGEVGQALAVADRANAGVLLDAIAASLELRPPDADDSVWVELRRLRAEWQWQFGKLRGGAEADEEPHDRDDETLRTRRTAAGAALHQIEVRSRELWWEVQRRRQRGAPESRWEVSRLADLQAGLPADTALVEYFAHRDRLLAFVVTHRGLDVITGFPVGLRKIERSLAVLELTLKSVDSAGAGQGMEPACRRHLAWFYRAVMGPVAHLLEGCRRLVVAPFGPLHYLPFAALHDGQRYLVEALEVVCLPAAELATFEAPGAVDVASALVVGCSDGGRLPHVLDELAAVTTSLPRPVVLAEDAATLERLRAESGGRRLLHLAAHGVFRGDNPLFSYLQLADGPLRLLDIYDLRLDADLVVLSACETGVHQVHGGDLVGLCRGFLTAGAGNLIVSLWRVDDAATAELMAAFYRGLGAGEGIAASLRAAQLAVLARQPHPYFWAPFVVIGSEGIAMPPRVPTAGRRLPFLSC